MDDEDDLIETLTVGIDSEHVVLLIPGLAYGIDFTPEQARKFAGALLRKARKIDNDNFKKGRRKDG